MMIKNGHANIELFDFNIYFYKNQTVLSVLILKLKKDFPLGVFNCTISQL